MSIYSHIRTLLKNWKKNQSNGRARIRPHTRRPRLGVEQLEDRITPNTVTGTVYEDVNGNGVRDYYSEPGQSGVTVYLDMNRNAIRDTSGTPEPSTVTGADGSYTFTGLAAGTYVVRESVPVGNQQTSPGPGIANAGPGVYFGTAYFPAPYPTTTELVEIDAGTGKVTRIGGDMGRRIEGLVMTNDGSLFGVDSFNNFYSVNRTTGLPTLIGAAGMTIADGLTYDSATDTIFGLSIFPHPAGGVDVSLVVFNRTTGAATTIGPNVTRVNNPSGLAFDWVNNRVLLLDNISANYDTKLYAFDVATGAGTLLLVIQAGSDYPYDEGVAFNGQYLAVGSGRTLRYINPTTGPSTKIVLSESLYLESLEYLRSEPFARRVVVGASGTVTGVDFGNNPHLGSIQGTIFDDYDADGVRDPNEPGQSGVTVYLDRNRNGVRDTNSSNPEPSAVTDTNGNYQFAGIVEGTYVVREVVPPNYDQTSPGPGTGNAGPGVFFGTARYYDEISQNIKTQLVEIDPTTAKVIDIGTPMDRLMEGLVMTNDGTFYGIDDNDNFCSVNRATGQVTVIGAAGFTVAGGLTYDPVTDNIYGLVTNPFNETSLAVFNRATGAATAFQPRFGGFPDVRALAFDWLGNRVLALAHNNQVFAFSAVHGQVQYLYTLSVAPSTHSLAFDGQYLVVVGFTPTGSELGYLDPFTGALIQTKSLSGFTALESLEFLRSEPFTKRVTVERNQAVSGIDFGNSLTTGSIQGTIFEDYDADGVRDANEPAQSGVTVYLDNNRNAIYDTSEPSTVTDSNGNYAFNGIKRGDYVVREVIPAQHRQTLAGPGIDKQGPGVYFATGFDHFNQPLPLMEIDAKSGKVTFIGAPMSDQLQGLIMTNDGSLYGTNGYDKFNRVDRTTGQITFIGQSGFVLSGGLAYDPATDTIYSYSNTTRSLLTINRTTGAATTFLPSTGSTGFDGAAGLAFDWVNNRVLAIDGNGELYAFDPATGAVTLLTVLQYPPNSFVSSLAFDGQNVVVGLTDGFSQFLSLGYFNPVTGALIATKSTAKYGLMTSLEHFRSEPFTHRVTVGGGQTVTADFGNKAPNRAPVANAGGPYTISEGGTLTLNASGSDVEGSLLNYEWDLDGDGHFDDASGTSPTLTWAQLTSLGIADSGVFTIGLRVTDADPDGALSSTTTTTLTVVNDHPRGIRIEGPSSGVIGQPMTFTLIATDASPVDQAAGFTFHIDWDGNGFFDQIVFGTSGTTVTHTYNSEGFYKRRLYISDKDGGFTSSDAFGITYDINITRTLVADDPLAPGKTMLLVGGTPGDDRIGIGRLSRDGTVTVMLNGVNLGDFALPGGEFSRVVVYGQAGNDDIKVHSANKFSTWLYGGDGNDRLRGGGGNDVILGEAGDDLLAGGGGRNLLIGGTGADEIVGGEQEDIIVTGYTLYDGNELGLSSIMAEWASGRSWATRVQNLRDGSGSADRANGNYFLRDGETVFQDASIDTVAMTAGPDWLFVDPVRDKLTDLTNAIFIPDLSFILGD